MEKKETKKEVKIKYVMCNLGTPVTIRDGITGRVIGRNLANGDELPPCSEEIITKLLSRKQIKKEEI